MSTFKNALKSLFSAENRMLFPLSFRRALLLALLIISLVGISSLTANAQFTNVAAALGVDLDGNKDGGVAWGDFNNDGCLDLLVNTNTDNVSHRSRLYQGSCGGAFTDVTFTHANGLSLNKCERSAVWADINNDGYLDFGRNTSRRFELYLNQGPTGTPAYSFGDATHNPNLVVTGIPGGINTEGFGWMDYNEDGWLDLMLENHNFGIDIYENPANGTAAFFHVTPNGGTKGLPTGGTTGDFMALTDYDNDGLVDIIARKENESDIWINNGAAANPQFTANPSFNVQARNNNKGGVACADFDNDGDFDFFWSDHYGNEIFQQTGVGTGNFVATGEPANSALGGAFPNNVNLDGVATADVNHDGKVDLFCTDVAGASYLFLNASTGPGNFTFIRNNLGINVNGNGEGVAFADFDNDGDLDLYVNVRSGPNQLWLNGLNNTNFLKVKAQRRPVSALRDDIGATVTLKDCNNNIVSGIRELNGTRGHGSQDHHVIHFGLPLGPAQIYVVEIGYTQVNGVRVVQQIALQPDLLPNQTLIATNTDPTDLNLCVPQSVDLLDFKGQVLTNGIELDWTTGGELNSDHFVIERSQDYENYSPIGEVTAAGFATTENTYSLLDPSPHPGVNHYRLIEVDRDGTSHRYADIELYWGKAPRLQLYPSLTTVGEEIMVAWPMAEAGEIRLDLIHLDGRVIRSERETVTAGAPGMKLSTAGLQAGMWMVRLHQGGKVGLGRFLIVR